MESPGLCPSIPAPEAGPGILPGHQQEGGFVREPRAPPPSSGEAAHPRKPRQGAQNQLRLHHAGMRPDVRWDSQGQQETKHQVLIPSFPAVGEWDEAPVRGDGPVSRAGGPCAGTCATDMTRKRIDNELTDRKR